MTSKVCLHWGFSLLRAKAAVFYSHRHIEVGDMLSPPIRLLAQNSLMGREKNPCNYLRQASWFQNTTPRGAGYREEGWKPNSQTDPQGGRQTGHSSTNHRPMGSPFQWGHLNGIPFAFNKDALRMVSGSWLLYQYTHCQTNCQMLSVLHLDDNIFLKFNANHTIK